MFDEVRKQWERERPDLDVSGAEVVWRITFIHKHLKKATDRRLEKFDLPVWAFDVLAALRRQGSPYQSTPSELSAAALLTSGAMTNRLDRLEASGWIERVADPDDRRSVIVRLTDKGLELVDKAAAVRFEQASHAVRTLEREERQQLAALLRKLVSNTTEVDMR